MTLIIAQWRRQEEDMHRINMSLRIVMHQIWGCPTSYSCPTKSKFQNQRPTNQPCDTVQWPKRLYYISKVHCVTEFTGRKTDQILDLEKHVLNSGMHSSLHDQFTQGQMVWMLLSTEVQGIENVLWELYLQGSNFIKLLTNVNIRV